MKFKADEIASVIQKEIEQFEACVDVHQVGRVIEVGDGIAQVYGLSGVMAGEMLEFPHGASFRSRSFAPDSPHISRYSFRY